MRWSTSATQITERLNSRWRTNARCSSAVSNTGKKAERRCTTATADASDTSAFLTRTLGMVRRTPE